ncbi:ubiquitin-2 like Rad60 SUMO-like-domain-containing protein [Dipodascopsis tothii]|uniref:ubiquitin-2 like Rad60 SUMO-like-domain-containing protein n=1 Tax=Dipodascopsis tothii TaxID=44089 RepID=UPI0034CF9E19
MDPAEPSSEAIAALARRRLLEMDEDSFFMRPSSGAKKKKKESEDGKKKHRDGEERRKKHRDKADKERKPKDKRSRHRSHDGAAASSTPDVEPAAVDAPAASKAVARQPSLTPPPELTATELQSLTKSMLSPPPAPRSAELYDLGRKEADEGDDLFPELAARARQLVQKKEYVVNVLIQTDIPSPLPEGSDAPGVLGGDSAGKVPPQLFKVWNNMAFGKLKAAWLRNSGFRNREDMDMIVFAWHVTFGRQRKSRLVKIYDETTPGLLLGKEAGELVRFGDDDEPNQLVVEAMYTMDYDLVVDSYEQEPAEGGGLEQQINAAEPAPEPAPEPEPEPEDGYRLTLQSAAYAPLNLLVRPDSKIARIADHFRKKHGLAASATVRLVFDDETLNPGDTVADTELEDDVTIDVHVQV